MTVRATEATLVERLRHADHVGHSDKDKRLGLCGEAADALEAKDEIYDGVERWMREFYDKAATNFNGTPAYYENAASGLALALQEIDNERYERTSSEIWNEYQTKKAVHND
jgi:hypothetical protein